jgi:hypothetical protein
MYTLITAAASSQAYQLKNKLNTQGILLGDYLELPAIMIATGSMINLPSPTSTAYAHQMLTLCLDKQINTIYALRDEEQALLNESAQLFDEYGIQVHSP